MATPHTKRFYVIVAIDVQSDKPITDEIVQDISSEMDYSFKYENNNPNWEDNPNTVIVDTEIQDTSSVPFF